jgi:hypothetical protein
MKVLWAILADTNFLLVYHNFKNIFLLLILAIIAITITFIMPIIMKSRVLCCSSNRATVHDIYRYSPTITTQMKKPIKPETESRTPLGKEQLQPASAFRSIPSLTSENFDDILSLKRANPVCDSDEEDFLFFVRRQLRQEKDDEEESTVHRTPRSYSPQVRSGHTQSSVRVSTLFSTKYM